jgi:hypothetical protein
MGADGKPLYAATVKVQNRAAWGLWLTIAPKRTITAATTIVIVVRGMEKLQSCAHALFLEVMA